MSYQALPTSFVREKIAAILTATFPDLTIYPEFPHMGASASSIVMQQVSGVGSDSGFGEIVGAGKKGQGLRFVFQFDIYMDTAEKRDQCADELLYALFENRSDLLEDGIRAWPAMMVMDLPADEVGSRLYRKMIQSAFEIEMTRAA